MTTTEQTIEQWKLRLGEPLWESLRTVATPSALFPVLSMLSKNGISFQPVDREEVDLPRGGPPASAPELGCTLVDEFGKPCGESVTADGACHDHCRPCPHCGGPIRQENKHDSNGAHILQEVYESLPGGGGYPGHDTAEHVLRELLKPTTTLGESQPTVLVGIADASSPFVNDATSPFAGMTVHPDGTINVYPSPGQNVHITTETPPIFTDPIPPDCVAAEGAPLNAAVPTARWNRQGIKNTFDNDPRYRVVEENGRLVVYQTADAEARRQAALAHIEATTVADTGQDYGNAWDDDGPDPDDLFPDARGEG